LDNNKYIYSYGNFCGDGLFIKNYDNFCDINKPGSVDNIKYPLFLKLSLFDKNTLFYYSFDMESWILCYETDMPINMSLDDLYIGVKVELSDENMYYNWVYSNYIQVMLNNGWVDNPDNISLDYYVAPQKNYNYYTVHNLLDFKYENPKLILNYVSDIIDYIVYQINYKYYVEILLNEKYIPNRNAYNKYDYNHTNLIYGYDEDKKILYIMGFNKLGKPELSEISYDIFNVAYNTSYTYANIYMLKYVPDFSMYKLNTHEIISSIDEYIHGCNTSIRFGNLFMPLNNTFGLQVYDELMKNDRNIDIFIHDVRISYLLFEHKKIMRDRISYLAKRGLINLDHSTDILCLMENIYSKSELITNLVIKYSINHDENIKNRITILMNDVKEMEKICYTNLLNLLKSDLGIQ
jgi:hypothetical protein